VEGSEVQGSAPSPAKRTAGITEKETEVSYNLHGIRLRAQGVSMQFIRILFVVVLVLVVEKSKFVKKLLDTASRTSTTTRTTTKSLLCNRVRKFTKMTLDFMKFHTRVQRFRINIKTEPLIDEL
jgi:hypothetical protein